LCSSAQKWKYARKQAVKVDKVERERPEEFQKGWRITTASDIHFWRFDSTGESLSFRKPKKEGT